MLIKVFKMKINDLSYFVKVEEEQISPKEGRKQKGLESSETENKPERTRETRSMSQLICLCLREYMQGQRLAEAVTVTGGW